MQTVALSLINTLAETGVRRAGERQGGGFLLFLATPLILRAISGKGVKGAAKGYNNTVHTDKVFQPWSFL